MKILGVFAHLDDAEIWAGGTMVKHSNRGDKIISLVFAAPGDERILESKSAHQLLGAELVVSSINNLENRELAINQISSMSLEFLPDIIITHWQDDSHPDHRTMFDLVSKAIVKPWIKTSLPKMLLSIDTYSSLGLSKVFQPNIYIDISSVWNIKLQAIAQFKSQPFIMWQDMITEQNALFGQRVLKDYAEGFIQIPIQGKLSAKDYLD